MILSTTPNINAYNVDCMEFMKDIPNKYYDWAIVDPPYFSEAGKINFPGAEVSNGIKRKRYESIIWDVPDQDYFDELKRVSKHQIIWGINYFWDIQFEHAGGRIIWDKQNDTSSFSHCEIALCSKNKGVRIFRYLWNGMIQQNMKNKERRIHPTQKPVPLYKWLLKNYANPRDKILDTHGGSMRSAVACYQMGYDLDVCELDLVHFENAVEDFKLITSQKELFTI